MKAPLDAATFAALTPHDFRELSVMAQVSPPTVRRVLLGESVQPSSKRRVIEALQRRKLGRTRP